MSSASPFKRPYQSRRRRAAAKQTSTKSTANKMLLRLLAVLFLVMLAAITVLVKDVGKSDIANGAAMSGP